MQIIFSFTLPILIYEDLHVFFHNSADTKLALVIAISFVFILNLGYLMLREYITNMRNIIKINNAIHHYINNTILKSAMIFMTLTSISTLLDNILYASKFAYVSKFALIISLMIFSFLEFILSDIIYNGFIYSRNKYIFGLQKKNIFPKSTKIIFNITKDKMSSNPHIVVKYSHTERDIICLYSYVYRLRHLYRQYQGRQLPELNSFGGLLDRLIRSSREDSLNYTMLDLYLRWRSIAYGLNHINIRNDNISNAVDGYKEKIWSILDNYCI